MATNQQVIDALAAQTAAINALAAALVAPATGKVAKAKAAAPAPNGFVTFLHERAASKVACEIHAAKSCNRTFTPASSGRTSHVARIV